MKYPNGDMLGQRYRLVDEIGAGGMGIVYRAYDRLAGQYVALKRLTAPGEQIDFLSRIMDSESEDIRLVIAKEFSVLSSLRHPNIISVLDYGFDGFGQPFFTMELLENAQPLLSAGADRAQHVQVEFLVQILRALAYLHRRGVIHRDLKPDNVLVTGEQVKVLDFGLALSRETMADDVTSLSGTLSYMAPEVLNGQPASERADLYAVGVMAYELFTGHHPFAFEGLDVIEFAYTIQNVTPDFSSSAIPKPLADVVSRLLVKQPEDRYPTAHDVVNAFSEATGLPVPVETTAIRESFLQAARFVGREKEVKTLQGALAQTNTSHGSAWLIGGESGVGKSRLLNEVRTRALVQGLLVMQGRVEPARGGYLPWYDIVRWLAILSAPNDLEAGVLQAIVPDIEHLIGRTIAKAPEIDPQRAQQRLFAVVTEMVKRLAQPALILMEDLHWASAETIALFRSVAKIDDARPIMVLGSFRNDEKPRLPIDLAGTRLINLQRLSNSDIVVLSRSMLGDSSTQGVVEFLQRETEGNAFFMVEVVRALAEQTGQLQNIEHAALTEQILTGGIRGIIETRLQKMRPEDRPLVKLAAVAGRFLDLNILKQFDAVHDFDQWLINCSDVAVLDVQNGQWQFTHDKLREAVLADISENERSGLHRRVAIGIETAYTDITNHAARLAMHWAHASDPDQEGRYSLMAGRQAAKRFANDEALRYLQRAQELAPEDLSIAYELAQVWETTGNWRAAVECLHQTRHNSHPPIEEQSGAYGYNCSLLGEFLIIYQSNYEEGFACLQTAREIFEKVDDKQGLSRVVSTIGRAYINQGDFATGLHYLNQQLVMATNLKDHGGVSEAYLNIGHVYAQQTDYERAQSYYTQALDTAEKNKDLKKIAASHGSLGVLSTNMGDLVAALNHNLHQLETYRNIGDISGAGSAVTAVGSLYMLVGDYETAVECCAQGVDTNLRLENMLDASIALIYLAECFAHQERYTEAKRVAKLAIAIVRHLNRLYHLAGYLMIYTEMLFDQSKFNEASDLNAEVIQVAGEISSRHLQFEAELMQIRLGYAHGQVDGAEIIKTLREWVIEWTEPEYQASLLHAIWEVGGDPMEEREAAAELYRTLYQKSPQMEYRRRFQQLTGQDLSELTHLPQLPDIIKAQKISLGELLLKLDTWLETEVTTVPQV